ncbi:uncharacterized protein LOC134539010 [Bacillus rossius redtenbacheri]|uniref:uncharacterized protein LOC134539010 n=1 Tax=Bacillus rossius redtenbacheri TaxID=93214 RepID=UPI002FDD315B
MADSSGELGKGHPSLHPSPEEAMSLSLKVLYYVGWWPVKESNPYRLYTIVMSSSYPLFYLLMAWFFLSGGKTTTIFLEQAGFVLAFIPITFNIMTVLFKRRQFQDVIANLRSFIARTSCVYTEGTLRDAIKEEYLLVVLFTTLILTAGLSRLAEPIGTYYLIPQAGNNTGGLHLLIQIYTIEEISSLAFGAMFAIQYFVFGCIIWTLAAAEILMYVLILYTANQFEIIIALIRNVGGFDRQLFLEAGVGHTHCKSQMGRKSAGDLMNGVIDTISQNPERILNELQSARMNRFLNSTNNRGIAHVWEKLVVYHQEALRNAAELCELFRTALFLNYALASVVICTVLYQLKVVESPFLILFNCFYVAGVTFRLFLMSIFSTRLSMQSEQISDEVAATEWFEYNNAVKVTLVIMMSRAQRPVQMWAGRFAVMSLETFSAVSLHPFQ